MPGATRVVEGVWEGGRLTPEQKNSTTHKVRKYMGYASWYTGQLDGELRSEDWSLNNNITAQDVFTDENKFENASASSDDED